MMLRGRMLRRVISVNAAYGPVKYWTSIRNMAWSARCIGRIKHFVFYVLFMVIVATLVFDALVSVTPTEKRSRRRVERKGTTKKPVSTEILASDLAKTVKQSKVYYRDYVSGACAKEERNRTASMKEMCPCLPHGLRGRIKPNTTALLNLTWPEAEAALSAVRPGGYWRPRLCAPRRRVAVIIPYRDRERHLRAFLAHTHPILQRQLLEYRIFVVEQEMPYIFNKGSTMNAGYLEVETTYKPDCVLFHDVDLLMENDTHIIVCTNDVEHMGAFIDSTSYVVPYVTLLGGAVLLSRDTFRELNGYSNRFFGWGGEDDDLQNRVMWRNRTMVRAPIFTSSYTAIKHARDTGNPLANDRKKGILFNPDVYIQDGLSNANYTVLRKQVRPLYTWIQVRIHQSNASERSELFNSTVPYRVKYAGCQQVPEGPRRELSPVTCMYSCEQEPSCIGVYYRHNKDTASYCTLMSNYCQQFVPSNNTKLYFKPRLIQYS